MTTDAGTVRISSNRVAGLSGRVFPIVIVFLLGASECHAQREWPKPNWKKAEGLDCRQSDKSISKPVGKYEVRLIAEPGTGAKRGPCQAYLIDPAGRESFLLEDWGISIHQGTGWDLFGDGNPSLILEGYSGGAHCCYTYRIASLGERPVILPPVQNEAPFYVFKDPVSRKYRIMTSDGAFDYFDGLCHACASMPRVVLEADASGLHDVWAQFTEQYDSEIAAARAKIGEGNMSKFLAADFKDAKPTVLEIVYSYLYSGRESDAWQVLDEMWPASDRERIKALILKTRAAGILQRIQKLRPEPMSRAQPTR